jgi:CRP-like cAMP-binding protein
MRYSKKHRPDLTPLRLIGLDEWLTDPQLCDLALHTDAIRVPAGEVLVRTGTMPRQFIAVVDGYVDVTDGRGDPSVSGPGTMLGVTELIAGSPQDVRVTTRCATTVVVIYGPAFRATTASSALLPTPARFGHPIEKRSAPGPVRAVAEPAAT